LYLIFVWLTCHQALDIVFETGVNFKVILREQFSGYNNGKVKRFYDILQISLVVLLCAILILALYPMLKVAIYDFPMSDDYVFGKAVHDSLNSGGAFLGVLQASVGTVVHNYYKWQGTYSAIFIMSLQPGAFNEHTYAVTPFIMLGALIFATFRLLYTIICICLHEKKRMVIFLGVPMLLLMVEQTPSITQGFYWFNGACYYTLFYSIMLIYLDTLILLVKNVGKRSNIARFILAVFLAAILGGGNFVTALLTVLLGFTYCFYCFLRWRKSFLFAVFLQGILLSGFLISVLAPGNAVRQAKHQKLGLIETILYSFGQARNDICHWTTVAVILALIIFIPVLYIIAGRCRLRFKLPGLFAMLSILLFAAQNAPPFYAMSWAGEGRLRDIVYYSYFWFLFVNEFYILGWLRKKTPELPGIFRALNKKIHLRELCKATFCIAVTGGAIVLLLIDCKMKCDKFTKWGRSYDSSTLSIRIAPSIVASIIGKYRSGHRFNLLVVR
jgi:hypothetical protein